ncbi:MAG: hypothetical protein LBQ13_02945 [Endomicrobium sp.]|nr:hypothetical protein [Endomicrobium sp.]
MHGIFEFNNKNTAIINPFSIRAQADKYDNEGNFNQRYVSGGGHEQTAPSKARSFHAVKQVRVG